MLADPSIWPPDDFVEYWAAAKLTVEGKNPYDPQLLLPLQQFAGRKTDEAVMMWNPPWSLAVVLPLGLLPARIAQLLWFAANLLAIGYCGDRLWLLFGGPRSRRWLGWLVVLVAMPTAFALQSGQIGPLLLLGGVLFLECRRRGWDYLAGAATVLLAIKPHLAYLVWAAIAYEAIACRRWRTVIGGVYTGLMCTGIALALNPELIRQYLDALGNRPPAQWVSPTLGTVLRLAFGEELFRLQFVPVVFGFAWFAWYWRRHAPTWNWNEQFANVVVSLRETNPNVVVSLRETNPHAERADYTEQFPSLLLVSFVTAPYGAWPFDMVLLLPAVFWLLLHTPQPQLHRVIVTGLIAIDLGCLVLNLLAITSFWFLWVSPAVLVLYMLPTLWRQVSPRRAMPAPISSDRELVTA